MKQFLLFVTALCIFSTCATAQGILFVKPVASGTGDGSSWANASGDLQAMINASGVGDQVWVAAGTYKPTTGTDRTISFTMKNDCGIYGGFAGTETLLSQRNVHTNATILSGDIGTPNNNSDNSYHIFYNDNNGLTNTAVLDGFTVRDGNSNGTGTYSSGSGIYNNLNVSPTISNCSFLYNIGGGGSGVYNTSGSNSVITNCVFAFNTGTFNNGCGAAVADVISSSTLTNCLFISNTATNGNGGAISEYQGNLTATNCTFYGNQAVSGGALYISVLCNVSLKNCIVWGNTAGSFPQYSNNVGSTLTMTYTDIQGGYSGTGNINSDPLFPNTADADGADNIFGTSDDGFKLTALSPAINGGNNSNIPVGITTDITGGSRIQNTTVDMGAYETLVVSSTHYVKTTASGTADGTSWANASADLQAMINASGFGDQVWVAAGTYKPTTTTNRSISFAMKNNCAIYGGFAGTETLLSQRDFHTNVTILSGDIGTLNNNSDNTYHVFFHNGGGLTNTAVLDGFTIRDGNANGTGNNLSGGGMFNIGCSPTISNCSFLSNSASSGGAVFNNTGSNCVFTNCVFAFNTATFGGASGGAFIDGSSSSTLTNCVFVSNNASNGSGGAIDGFISNLTATNCTFYNNHASVKGGALYISSSCNFTFKNCIVWGNTAGSDPQYFLSGGALAMTYSDMQGGYSGTGNINSDPLFPNTADADGADNIYGTADDGLFVSCSGPAFNAGDNTGVAATDITGNARIQFTTVDMGAYELASLAGVTWYYDGDNDGYYGSTTASCTSPGAGWSLTTNGADCNDNDIFTHAAITWYQDADGDNYYGATQSSCTQPGAGWYDVSLSGGGDCDDNNAAIHPGATEIANGLDDNCNGQTDEGFIRYVKTAASGTGDGSSWANASSDLQAMINASVSGGQVWVAAGTYKPTTGTDRSISFTMKNNCGIYGGFACTETLLTQRNFHTNATILSGDIGTLNDNSDNSFHVVDNESNGLTSTAILDGFTIRDGNANIFSGYISYGGGMFNYQASPTVSNCIFIANTAQGGGAAFDRDGSNALYLLIVYLHQTQHFLMEERVVRFKMQVVPLHLPIVYLFPIMLLPGREVQLRHSKVT